MEGDGQQPLRHRRPLLPPAGSVALVALGGVIGTLARHGLSRRFPVAAAELPVSTFAENVAGAALLGLLVAVLVSDRPPARRLRLLLATGALGAFTTFSTFATELALLAREGRTGLAAAYAGATLAAGVIAAAAGVRLGGWVSERVQRPRTAGHEPVPQEAPTR